MRKKIEEGKASAIGGGENLCNAMCMSTKKKLEWNENYFHMKEFTHHHPSEKKDDKIVLKEVKDHEN